jgi:pyrroloquinoline quinone biosynthesis protein B
LRRGATSLGLIDPLTNRKYLFEATPDLPSQLFALEQQAPSERYSFGGVFLTHAHIGHYAGLMFFGHEAMGADKIAVYGMPRMQSFLKNNGPWSQLVDYQNIVLKHLQSQLAVKLDTLSVTPFLVPHRDEFSETVGYRIDGPNKSAIFIPDIDKWSKWSVDLPALLTSVDYALIDATFFGDGELPGRDMSKVPHPLVTESMSLLDKLLPEQKNKVWFIHMNHTNPLLQADSQESQQVRAKGYNIAVEGLRLPL